jgi:hypothetical protein
VGGFYAFGHELANFKTVHTLRKSAVYLVGTHNGLRSTLVIVAWGAELVRSGGAAKAEQSFFLNPDS